MGVTGVRSAAGSGTSRGSTVDRSAFAKLHRDDLDPARLGGRINGAEVDRGAGEAVSDDEHDEHDAA